MAELFSLYFPRSLIRWNNTDSRRGQGPLPLKQPVFCSPRCSPSSQTWVPPRLQLNRGRPPQGALGGGTASCPRLLHVEVSEHGYLHIHIHRTPPNQGKYYKWSLPRGGQSYECMCVWVRWVSECVAHGCAERQGLLPARDISVYKVQIKNNSEDPPPGPRPRPSLFCLFLFQTPKS